MRCLLRVLPILQSCQSRSTSRRSFDLKTLHKFIQIESIACSRAILFWRDLGARTRWVEMNSRGKTRILFSTHPVREIFLHSFVRGLASSGPQHQKKVPRYTPGDSPNRHVQKPCKKSRFRTTFCVPWTPKKLVQGPTKSWTEVPPRGRTGTKHVSKWYPNGVKMV